MLKLNAPGPPGVTGGGGVTGADGPWRRSNGGVVVTVTQSIVGASVIREPSLRERSTSLEKGRGELREPASPAGGGAERTLSGKKTLRER